MPIRLTCPSCSATLSVKDENAGRAIQCPRCGGVIPAPAPEPEPVAAEVLPEPAPAAPEAERVEPEPVAPEPLPQAVPVSPGVRIVGAPVSRPQNAGGEDRPRRPRDEAADRDRPRRRCDEPADRDAPPEGRSGVGLVIAILAGILLLCCGSFGLGGWLLIEWAKEHDRKRGTTEAPIEITAAALAKEQRADPQGTLRKYANRWLIVEGTFEGCDIGVMGETVKLDNGVHCSARGDDFKGFFDVTKGQRIKIKARCSGGTLLSEGTLEWSGPDPAVQVTAQVLLNDYKDRDAGDAKYKDKEVTVSKAQIEELPDGDVVLVPAEKAAGRRKILAETIGARRVNFPNLTEGMGVTVKGTCKGLKSGNVLISDARLVP